MALMAGCSGGTTTNSNTTDNTSDTNSTTDDTNTTDTSTDSSTAQVGTIVEQTVGADQGTIYNSEPGTYLRDKITVAISSDGGSFDPLAGFVSWGSSNFPDFQYLFRYDRDGNLQPELVKEWEQIDDLTYQMTLWDCIYDSDGNQITTDDVIYSVNAFVDAGNSGAVSSLDHIEKVDDYTFLWVNSTPFLVGQALKQWTNVKVWSEKAYNEHDFTTDPVATGAYIMTEYVPGSTVIYTANEDFWMNKVDFPDDYVLPIYDYQNVREIEFQIIQDASSRAIALEMGSIDLSDSLNAIDVDNFGEDSGISRVELPQDPPIAFVFNCNEASACSDVNVRKAICYAIDNVSIASSLEVTATAAYGWSPRMYDAPESWTTGEGRDWYNYDLSKAQEYLDASDYDGQAITIMYSSGGVGVEDVAIILQGALKELGLNIELYATESSTARDVRKDPTKWDLAFDTFGGGNYVYAVSGNLSNFNNNGYAAMLIDDEKLDELYTLIQNDNTEENIATWEQYVFEENCYAYSICLYSNVTACLSDVNVALTPKNQSVPNACTFND
jgi:ABC-type transport system substrate-binding protein